MDIFLLAAGFGTRLKPITEKIPKPLIPFLNIPMINYPIELFYQNGFKNFYINTSYLSNKFENFKPIRDIEINFSYEKKILGTGGGLKKVFEDFNLDGPIFIMNSDIIFNIDIGKVIKFYKKLDNPLSLMVLQPNENGNVTASDGKIRSLRGFKSKKSEQTDKNYCFTGVHIVSKEVLKDIKSDSYTDIIDTYISLLDSERVYSYIDQNSYWRDIGKLNTFFETSKEVINNRENLSQFSDLLKRDGLNLSNIDSENSIIGKNVKIPNGVFVKNSVILDNYKTDSKKDIIDRFCY